jgi:hypothetical protein
LRKSTPENIWNFAQNKPSLIVDDIVAEYPDIDRDFLYEILFRRGCFKWFAVRRDLIKLKNFWRNIIAGNNYHKKDPKLRGKMAQLILCREAVRRLCHSARWTVPDNDSKAIKWFNKKNEELKTDKFYRGGKLWTKLS